MGQQGEREVLFTGDDIRRSCAQSPYADITVRKPGWTKLLILAGLATTIGSAMPVGYNIGVVNSPAVIIKHFVNESVYTRYEAVFDRHQLDFLWSCIITIFLLGGAAGSLCGSLLANKIGRKGALIVSSLLGIVAGILFLCSKYSNSVEMLLIGRLLIGLSAGLTQSVMPMYLMELSPLHLRGATGVLCPLGVTFGVLMGQIFSMYSILGNEQGWPFVLALYALPMVLCGLLFPILPESPKYLYVVKKEPQIALKVLTKVRDMNQEHLNDEVQELKAEESENDVENESWTIGRVLRDKTLLLPLLLVLILQAGQQFSGINAVFYYSAQIFASAGLSRTNSELATIGAGFCNFLMAVVSIPIMSKYNRRIVIQISLASTSFFLVLLGLATIYITLYSWMAYLSIIGVLGFVLCYGIGLGPIPYFIGSELFEVGPRPSAMALGAMANFGGNFLVGLFFPLMQARIGAASFFLFAGFVVFMFIFMRFYLPETREKDVTEVAHLCSKGFKSRPVAVSQLSIANTEEGLNSPLKA